MTVHVVARYRCKPVDVAEIVRVLSRHAGQTEAEPGCLRFAVMQEVDDPSVFYLQESYFDEESFAAHLQTPHFHQNIEETVAPLLLERTWARVNRIGGA